MMMWQGLKKLLIFCLTFLVPVVISVKVFSEVPEFVQFNEPLKLNLEVRQLSMNEAIKLAILNNPRVTIEKSLISEKESSITEKRSFLLPQFYVTQDFISSNNPVHAFMMKLNQRNLVFSPSTINTPGTENNFSTRLGAEWSLLDRKKLGDFDISKLELDIQHQLSRQEILQLVYDVRKAYLDVKLAQKNVMNAKTVHDYAQSHFEAVKNKKEAGTASKSELLSAKVKLSSSLESYSKAKNSLNLSWIVFADIIGDETVIGFDLIDDMVPDYPVDDVDRLVKYAYLHSPEISAVESQKKLVLVNLKKAKATGALTVKAHGEWGVDTILDDRDIAQSFMAAVFLNKSIFDSGLKKSRVKKAYANIEKVDARIDQSYKQVKINVVSNYLDFKNAEERLKMTDDLLKDSEESLRAYNERYFVGLSSNLEVEAAQARLAQSQILRVHSLYDFNLAAMRLQKSMGLSLADILQGKGLVIDHSPSKPLSILPEPDNIGEDVSSASKNKPEPSVKPLPPEKVQYEEIKPDLSEQQSDEGSFIITPDDASKINAPYFKIAPDKPQKNILPLNKTTDMKGINK